MSSEQSYNYTVESINDDYEYLQYNSKLRLIRSIHDDMYNLQSIIDACDSNKLARKWLRNKQTQELLESFDAVLNENNLTGEKARLTNSVEKRDSLQVGLRGWYVHRLLVNIVATWASPKYAIYIAKLLDEQFEQERLTMQKNIDKLINMVAGKDETITSLNKLAVPKTSDKNFILMLWITKNKFESEDEDDSIVYRELKICYCNPSSFNKNKEYRQIRAEQAYEVYEDHLSSGHNYRSMIKNYISTNFEAGEYLFNCRTLTAPFEKLVDVIEFVHNQFEE